jgi:DNA-directed RNA polymerase subunit RPC12/RpoP
MSDNYKLVDELAEDIDIRVSYIQNAYNRPTDRHILLYSDGSTQPVVINTRPVDIEVLSEPYTILDLGTSLQKVLTGQHQQDEEYQIESIESIEVSTEELTFTVTLSNADSVDIVCQYTPISTTISERSTTSRTEPCPQCGTKNEVQCSQFEHTMYCSSCQQKFEREIETDDTKVFYCNECETIHKTVTDTEEWVAIEPFLGGREETVFICKCGNRTPPEKISIDNTIVCPKCNRTLTIDLDE